MQRFWFQVIIISQKITLANRKAQFEMKNTLTTVKHGPGNFSGFKMFQLQELYIQGWFTFCNTKGGEACPGACSPQ